MGKLFCGLIIVAMAVDGLFLETNILTGRKMPSQL